MHLSRFVILISVSPADHLILSSCRLLLLLLFSYSEEEGDNRARTAEMIGSFTQYTIRNVIKNSQLIGFLHNKAQSFSYISESLSWLQACPIAKQTYCSYVPLCAWIFRANHLKFNLNLWLLPESTASHPEVLNDPWSWGIRRFC